MKKWANISAITAISFVVLCYYIYHLSRERTEDVSLLWRRSRMFTLSEAIQSYSMKEGELLPVMGSDGIPYSWRVAILPSLHESQVFDSYDFFVQPKNQTSRTVRLFDFFGRISGNNKRDSGTTAVFFVPLPGHQSVISAQDQGNAVSNKLHEIVLVDIGTADVSWTNADVRAVSDLLSLCNESPEQTFVALTDGGQVFNIGRSEFINVLADHESD